MNDISLISSLSQHKLNIFVVSFATIFFALSALGCASKNSYVYLIDDSLIYSGVITREGADELIRMLKKKKATHFYINSVGGSSEEGLRIGEYLQENNISVTVAGRCYSSCANYIFLASKNRNIVSGSKLGLHGGYQSIYPRMLKLMENLPKDIANDYKNAVSIQQARMIREIELLKNANINPKIIEESALMTYYGDVNHIAKVDGNDKKFTLEKKSNTNYELWFPLEHEYQKWGITFNVKSSPFVGKTLWDQIFISVNDSVEINRSNQHTSNERNNMDK
jgi:hypothetical protein